MTAQIPPQHDPSIGRLVADLTRDLSDLVHREIELAKSELKVSVTAGGIGGALFAVAALLAVLLIPILSITVAYFLTMTGMHPAWAFLIVSGVYVLLIGAAVFVGIRSFKRVKAPEKTLATAKEIPAALKGRSA